MSKWNGHIPGRSSDPLAGVIRRVVYPLWILKNGSRQLRYLNELEKSQFYRGETLKQLQWQQLRALLAHAYRRCPFYRRRWLALGIEPRGIRTPDDFLAIPMTTKQDIQEMCDEMISEDFRREELIRDMTGGSTGSPLVFYYDRDRMDSRHAATIRHNRWAGWDIGDKVAVLWGATRDAKALENVKGKFRTALIQRQMILDASALSEETMRGFARSLLRYKPKILLGYANTLALFARFVSDGGITGIAPEAIVSSAEVLNDENRALMERTFGCPVYNRYGCREFAVIASECERRSGLHINAENLLVECLTDGRPSLERKGEIVITDLRNRAMPLIRYRTMDIGALKDELCGCGRGLPLMRLDGGRTTDFLKATDGRLVSGVVIATYVITNIRGLKQVQFVQTELGKLTIKVVKGAGWSCDTETQLIGKTREFLGHDLDVALLPAEQLQAEQSGKYRFSISTVAS